MDVKSTNPQEQTKNSKQGLSSSFSQYLSFRFYKENLEHLTDLTKGSINNFLKSITDIEAEFRRTMLNQPKVDLHDFGFDNVANGYMEENY